MKEVTWSTVRISGVYTSSSGLASVPASCPWGGLTAFSTLAAYPQGSLGQYTTRASPDSASTINSWVSFPPMAPESASTGLNLSPHRRKIRL